jgi:hypothetical protein
MAPNEQAEVLDRSWATISLSDSSCLTGWSGDTLTSLDRQLRLELAPGCGLVIGRQEGGGTEYLDPRYQPTRHIPGSSRPVLSGDGIKDIWVSRGHFMLCYHQRGIELINGVPHREGGIRPPKNGTWLLEPERRFMEKGESFLIEKGASATLRLPNGELVLITAG